MIILTTLKKSLIFSFKKRKTHHSIVYKLTNSFKSQIERIINKNLKQMSQRDFVVLKKLGQGSFGDVFKVRRLSDMNQYAMKKVKIHDMKQRDKNNALNEIRLLASLDHQNIIAYKEAFYDQATEKLCTIMELAENGDLSGLIKEKYKNGQYFYEFQIWAIGRGILKGLQTLHEAKIIHRDLKPANIFFGKNNTPKIGDMNVSILLNKEMAYTQTGTPYYASPQVWNNDPYSYQCDIWSFGCMLYQMCTFKPPFKGKNMDALYEKIQRCQYQKIPKRYSPQLQEVISLCLRLKHRRATISQLMRLFEKFQPPKSPSRRSAKKAKTCMILKTIKMPVDHNDFSKVLPKSKYTIQQFTLNDDRSNNQSTPETEADRLSETSLGKREESLRKNSNQGGSSKKESVQKSNPLRPPLVLGAVSSNKSLRRLQRNPSTKRILQIFSPRNQPSSYQPISQFDVNRPRSYLLQNLPSMKSQKFLRRQCRQQDYLKDCINLNHPSFKNILQSPKISTMQKLSVERLNLKRRKLRMALNY